MTSKIPNPVPEDVDDLLKWIEANPEIIREFYAKLGVNYDVPNECPGCGATEGKNQPCVCPPDDPFDPEPPY